MLDLKFVRENPDIVKQNIKNKFQDSKLSLVDEVIALDAENRVTQKEADDLRASRNKLSKEIGKLMAQGKKEEADSPTSSTPVSPLERMTVRTWRWSALGNRWCLILISHTTRKSWSALRALTWMLQEGLQAMASTI